MALFIYSIKRNKQESRQFPVGINPKMLSVELKLRMLRSGWGKRENLYPVLVTMVNSEM